MINSKLIEAALAMLARMIPPEEYAKGSAAIGELVSVAKSYDATLRRIEAKLDGELLELRARIDQLEAAAQTDSPAFNSMSHERAMWMVPGSIEKALAPSLGPNGEEPHDD